MVGACITPHGRDEEQGDHRGEVAAVLARGVVPKKRSSNDAGFEDDDLNDTVKSPAKPTDPVVEKNDVNASSRRKLDLYASCEKHIAANIKTSNEQHLGQDKDSTTNIPASPILPPLLAYLTPCEREKERKGLSPSKSTSFENASAAFLEEDRQDQ